MKELSTKLLNRAGSPGMARVVSKHDIFCPVCDLTALGKAEGVALEDDITLIAIDFEPTWSQDPATRFA
jgi:hypothetical protein